MNNDFQEAIRYNENVNFSNILTKIFSKMFLGLIVTAIASYFTYVTGLFEVILFNKFLTFGFAIAELALVIYLSARIIKMSKAQSNFWFYTYAVINGITMSYIFAAFGSGTIFMAFACSAIMFAAVAIYGYVTKKDLTSLGTVGLMLLFGIIITTLLNMFFFKSQGLDLFVLYAGLVVFAGITAYDIQNIKNMTQMVEGSEDNVINAVATMGALQIYLDFINIFLRILSIVSRKEDN